ncbi:MAG TPA: hypothetical protein VLB05_16700 [Dongiaceae bacterium]|nr:hypothetical protein [Dongiaceae bacterium]
MQDDRRTILIVGQGVLASAVLDFLAQSEERDRIVIAARDPEKLNRRVNLARYTALNLGRDPVIEPCAMDLMDGERSAALIASVAPDIIFNATTLHSWWIITQLPTTAFQRLDRARGGVWTPMHLVLIRRLMQAVRAADFKGVVVNASYPDVTHAALAAEGLSPLVGIGNVANAVPGLRLAAAHLLQADIAEVDVRFFAHHFLSYRMPSSGTTDGAPYHLTVYRRGKEVALDEGDHREIFSSVAGRFRRVKGLAGQSVTASSATAVLRALAHPRDRVVHAPGPLGLVGGYPVRFGNEGIAVDLPTGLSLDAAIEINRRCQAYDGIADIDASGTVHFTPEAADVLKKELGYDCRQLPLDACEERAEELARKFTAYRDRIAGESEGAAQGAGLVA